MRRHPIQAQISDINLTLNPRGRSDSPPRHATRIRRQVLIGYLLAVGSLVSCRVSHVAVMPEQDEVLQTVVLERGPDCSACEVVFTRLGSLGSPTDSTLLDRNSSITLLPDGRFIVAPTASQGEAAEFDSIGAASRRFGHSGDGPGESGSIRAVYPWAGDSVLLFEAYRFNFLTGQAGTGRSATYTKADGFSAIGIPGDGLIVVNSKDGGTGQFVVFDAQGAALREMGMPRHTGESYSRDAILGPAVRAHSFWAGATRYQHHLELRDVGGTPVKSFDGSPSWFIPFDSTDLHKLIRLGDLQAKPLSYLKSLRETGDGLVWTLYGVGARDWARQDAAPDTNRLHERLHKPYHRASYDGIVEVIDARTGRLLVAERISLPFQGFINDSLVYDRPENADGIWQLVIYKFKLNRSS